MPNFYRLFRDLLPQTPLLLGTVSALLTGGCYVELPGGGSIFARGTATVGQKVFVRDGMIEGIAPSLAIELIEV